MRIIDIADKILVQDYKNREFSEGYAWPQRSYFYPSQSNLRVNGAVAGACQRKLYYTMSGLPEPSVDAITIHKFERGNFFENWYQEVLRWSDIIDIDFKLVANNVKFKDEENKVSGEFDGIVQLNGEYIGLEIKTSSSNRFALEQNVDGVESMPKDDAVFQVMQYLHYCSKYPLKIIDSENLRKVNLVGIKREEVNNKIASWTHRGYSVKNETTSAIWLTSPCKQVIPCAVDDPDAMNIKEWRVIYWSNGEAQGEHTITLGSDGHVIINGVHYKDVNVHAIFDSRLQLIKYLESHTLPPRDYRLDYKDIEKLLSKRNELIKPLNRKLGGIKKRKAFNDKTHKDYKVNVEEFNKIESELESIENEFTKITQEIFNSLKVFKFKEESYQTWINGIIKGMKDKNANKADWQCVYCGFRNLCKVDYNLVIGNKDDKKV